ncbi:hypothetical protein [Streptomyces sp. ME19-01-6]|uniref:hypothetical protein n=1 Tax=Streptomyces sp. ME19-01-6 TaxID=3028686 RepID=UPI0029A38BA3|nr:hypothetical protein [Streptomyces sp. ME19-01-6]MDX3231890.1 hypothetical protein [Streptomyces sp. ME19-01-6]
MHRRAARKQAQSLMHRYRLAVPGIPVHAHDPAGGDGVRERLGNGAELLRGNDVRARHIQAYAVGKR